MDRAELSQALRASLGGEKEARSAELGDGSWEIQGKCRLIAEEDPQKFMTALADAVAGEGTVFLCDPKWGANERAQLNALISAPRSEFPSLVDKGWLCIPTGGTGGQLKLARHDEGTLAAAVAGFTQHFGITRVNAVGVLPLHHVSGLMAWLRCALTGGEYRPWEWKAVEAGAWPTLPHKAEGWMISLVPTQLERLLRSAAAVAWLKTFRVIFVGGGPTRPELLDQAAALDLRLSLGYGMTETAAMVTALRPEEFLAGERSSGRVLPQARVEVDEEGTIRVAGASLFHGYYPAWRTGEWFVTADAGWLDSNGYLSIRGRRDEVIISGGEKIDPAEVEAVLRGCGEFPDLIVLGLPDAEWGQVVVVAYPSTATPSLVVVQAALERGLAPTKRPKRFVPVASWPVNAQGKANRAAVMRWVWEQGEVAR